jgi:hypothetical protein
VRTGGGLVAHCSDVSAVHIGELSSGEVGAEWRRAQRTRGKSRYVRKHYGNVAAAISVIADVVQFLRHGPSGFRRYLLALSRDPRRGLGDPSDAGDHEASTFARGERRPDSSG